MTSIAKLSIEFGANFDQALAAAFTLQVKRRQDRIRRRVKTRVKNLITQYINDSQVAQSLRGAGGVNSLQAELGLEDGVFPAAAKKISEAIEGLIKVSVKSSGGNRTSGSSDITVSLPTNEELDSVLSYTDPDFAYISSPSGALIKWLAIVMKPSEALLDQFIPGIFDQKGDKYWGVRGGRGPGSFNSRSGLAVMVRKYNFPYTIPSILIPSGQAKNFIDQIFRSRRLRNDIITAIQEVAVEEINR